MPKATQGELGTEVNQSLAAKRTNPNMKSFIYSIFTKILLPFRVAIRFEIERELGKLTQLVKEVDRKREISVQFDLESALQRISLETSARYISKHMQHARIFKDKFSLLKFAMEKAHCSIDGVILEFGVYKGETLEYIADNTEAAVYGFDSFLGLPESWRSGFEEGHFKTVPPILDQQNIKLVVGSFNDSLPKFIQEHSKLNLKMIHIDCDLYSSTRDVLTQLHPFLQSGVTIVFDEYFNHPHWEQGEHKALLEVVESHGLKYQYIAYNKLSEQVAIVIL